MHYDMTTQPALTVVGRAIRASNDRGDLLGAHWQQFMGEAVADQIEGRIDGKLVAVYCDYEGDHTKPYTFLLGCCVDEGANVPEGMEKRTLPAGDYARIEAIGEPPGALIEAWMGVWGSDIERGFVTDYEIHDPANPLRTEIYVA